MTQQLQEAPAKAPAKTPFKTAWSVTCETGLDGEDFTQALMAAVGADPGTTMTDDVSPALLRQMQAVSIAAANMASALAEGRPRYSKARFVVTAYGTLTTAGVTVRAV